MNIEKYKYIYKRNTVKNDKEQCAPAGQEEPGAEFPGSQGRSVTPALVTPLPTLLLHFSYFPYLYLYLFALYLQLLEATLV